MLRGRSAPRSRLPWGTAVDGDYPGLCPECRPWDSNPHALYEHQLLRLACLPFHQSGMSFGSRGAKGYSTFSLKFDIGSCRTVNSLNGWVWIAIGLISRVHGEGLEPSRPEGHTLLRRARLPDSDTHACYPSRHQCPRAVPLAGSYLPLITGLLTGCAE